MTCHVPTLPERFQSLPDDSMDAEFAIERGGIKDYRALAQFHYRGAHPGAVTAVFRMIHRSDERSLNDRYRRMGLGIVNVLMKTQTIERAIAGVLVRSMPALSCRLRDIATGGRYSALRPRDAAIMLNREVRCISRVVVDPRFRGLGLAVKLVRHALHQPEEGVIYTAMGRISPFFEKAGMKRYDRPLRTRTAHARLLDALDHLRIAPAMLSSGRALEAHFQEHRDERAQAFLDREFRRWHKAAHRTPKRRLDQMTFDDLRTAARDELLLQPVYYLFHHSSDRSA